MLRLGIPVAALASVTWLSYYVFVVRPHFLSDYRYLFSANAYTGISVKSAEGALRRPVEFQVVNEYRGAISALNTGAPFMIGKGDSVLGRSVADFAKAVLEHRHGSGGKGITPDFEDGVRNQRVLAAIERAASSRCWERV